MKIFNYEIKKIKPFEERSCCYSPFGEALNFGNYSANSNQLGLSAVYRAVELISDSIAMLPIQIKAVNEFHKDVLPNHELNYIFDGGLIGKYNFIKLLIQSVLLKGNGYALIEGNKLRFLESSDVTINYDKAKGKLTYNINSLKRVVQPNLIIHLLKNSWDGVNGVSVLSFAARSLGIANNAENSAKQFFSNGCNLSGVLTVEGQLSDKQKHDIRTSWQQAYTNGANGLAVLQGNMKYQPIQVNSADAQLLESRLFSVQDIARFFGISPILLGDLSHSSYNTIEAAQNEFLLHTLQPYIVMLEEELTRKLCKGNIVINVDENYLLKTDKEKQASYYNTMLQSGILCINEVRRELGLEPIEGGDKHLISYTKIEDNIINKSTDGTETDGNTTDSD